MKASLTHFYKSRDFKDLSWLHIIHRIKSKLLILTSVAQQDLVPSIPTFRVWCVLPPTPLVYAPGGSTGLLDLWTCYALSSFRIWYCVFSIPAVFFLIMSVRFLSYSLHSEDLSLNEIMSWEAFFFLTTPSMVGILLLTSCSYSQHMKFFLFLYSDWFSSFSRTSLNRM